jgi:hypothetical protein
MIPRHPSDQVAADRKSGEHSSQRWQRCEQEACGALGFLSDWKEPRHDGPGTVARSLGQVNGANEAFTERLQDANTNPATNV